MSGRLARRKRHSHNAIGESILKRVNNYYLDIDLATALPMNVITYEVYDKHWTLQYK